MCELARGEDLDFKHKPQPNWYWAYLRRSCTTAALTPSQEFYGVMLVPILRTLSLSFMSRLDTSWPCKQSTVRTGLKLKVVDIFWEDLDNV